MKFSDIIEKYKIYGFKEFFKAAFQELKTIIYYRILQGSYSQSGEDLEIERILGNIKNGFFVDIGANDPVRFSNTYRFYKKGWKGINIEPNPEVFKKIQSFRPNDINLNIGIAPTVGKLKFFSFFPDTLSTFSNSQAEEYIAKGFRLIETFEVNVDTLENVFNSYLPSNNIDFLSVDTESFDFQVLSSNNWEKYRPKIICIEFCTPALSKLLNEAGYKEVFNNGLNVLYKLQ